MQLVAPDIAHGAIDGIELAKEWPFYLKFVGLKSFDCIAIGSSSLLHGDLLALIRNHVEARFAIRLEFTDCDVFDGYVEIDDDLSAVIRTMNGKSVDPSVEATLRQMLLKVKLP